MKKTTTAKYNIKDTNDTIILYPKYIPQKIPHLIQTKKLIIHHLKQIRKSTARHQHIIAKENKTTETLKEFNEKDACSYYKKP